jgi:hypothetical protein
VDILSQPLSHAAAPSLALRCKRAARASSSDIRRARQGHTRGIAPRKANRGYRLGPSVRPGKWPLHTLSCLISSFLCIKPCVENNQFASAGKKQLCSSGTASRCELRDRAP